MKKYYTILFLFVSFFAFSQNNGINFQGVGRNSTGAVLASQKISLRFSVVQGSETGTVEYVESKEVTTNAQGIFSVVIGDGTQISKTGNFTDINWKINPKFLRVEMDPAGGSSFAAMGTTRLQSVPFAYYANGVNADNVDGVLSASKGGTGVASISALKTALGVDQINNTSDLAKPISTATQTALDTKVSTATFSTTVATKANATDLALKANATDVALKAPLESPTFTGTVSGITKAMVGLSNVANTADLAKPISTATQEALDTKVSTATYSTTMATKANVADVALKAPLESPTFTGTVSGITKAMVGLSNVANTADLAKPISTATQEALDTKVSVATFSTTMVTKENATNKSAAIDLGAGATSDILFPTQKAVKTYVDTQVNVGGVADGAITTIKLADSAVTDEKVATGIDKAKVGLANVDNTADALKPISMATQEALDEKLSTMVFDSRLRNIAKLDESNYFTSEQNIFSGNQIVIGELTLPSGVLNLSLGTQILSGTDSPTTIQNRPDADFSIKTSAVEFEGIEFGEADPREHELKFTADGKLRFSDGSRIYPYLSDQEEELKNVFSIRSKTGGYIELKTTSEEEDFYWTFKDDGKIIFPDRGTTMGVTNGPGFSIFELNSPNAISLFVRDPYLENSTYGGINILQRIDQPFAIELITPGAESNNLNVWIYDSEGMLTFPDGTTLAGSYSGSTDFEFKVIENSGFKISTFQNDDDSKTLEFNVEGILTLPLVEMEPSDENLNEGAIAIAKPSGWDPLNKGGSIAYPVFYNGTDWVGLGSSVASGTSTPTSILYVDLNTNTNYNTILANENGFKFQFYQDGVGLEHEWSYNMNGSLTFPDGTIAAGNISNTGNFGFDTSPTNSGFSIITAGTTSGTTQLWKLGTDGGLTFPDLTIASGNISNTGKFGFDTRATENGFSILTGTSTGTTQLWIFDTNGVLSLPSGGDIKIGGTSVLAGTSNYSMNYFKVTSFGYDLTNARDITDGDDPTIWRFNLEHIPILNQVALYIRGTRLSPTNYTVSENVVILDINVWDSDPIGDYDIYIDYKY